MAVRTGMNNNYACIRLVAALFVFAGHMGMVLNGRPPLLGSMPVHELGVAMLFLIGGCLVSQSWERDKNIPRFAVRRFFRLWPPFAFMILVMTFVSGPLLSELGIRGYFSSWYKEYLNNLRFYIVFAQPGVFTGVPVANVTNGSLWTMPVEAAAYILTPFLAWIMLKRTREGRSGISGISFAAPFVIAFFCALDLYFILYKRPAQFVIYRTDLYAAWHLLVFFVIGIIFGTSQVQKYLNVQAAFACLMVSLVFQFNSPAIQYPVLYVVLPYCVFSFAYAKPALFSGMTKWPDLSYGIYLYGFFFQQMIMQIRVDKQYQWGYLTCLIISLIPTLAAAVVSCLLVERPAAKAGRYLIKRLKQIT